MRPMRSPAGAVTHASPDVVARGLEPFELKLAATMSSPCRAPQPLSSRAPGRGWGQHQRK